MSTHTPGPWYVSKGGYYIRKADKPGWPDWNVAEINVATDAAVANANLIAAAPELLEACDAARALIRIIDEANPGGFAVGMVLLTLDNVIAKAKGG